MSTSKNQTTGNNNTLGGGGGEEEEDDDDDEQFEAKNGDKIRRGWSRSGMFRVLVLLPPLNSFVMLNVWLTFYAQGIAEHVIIEYIEMHQSMCHKYLTFHFGPQINLIIGLFFSFMPCLKKRLIPATFVVGITGVSTLLCPHIRRYWRTLDQVKVEKAQGYPLSPSL